MGVSDAWRNECEGWAALGRSPEAAGLFVTEQCGPLTCAWWQRDPEELENYLLLDPAFRGDLASVLKDVAPRVAASPAGTVLRFAETELAGLFRSVAFRFGYWDAGSAPVMVCPLDESRPLRQPAAQIRVRVAGEDDYFLALEVAQTVFGGTRQLTRFFNPRAPFRVYAGCWEDEVVSVATLWPFANVAGVYSVATLPAYEGRGLATAVVGAVLRDAAAAGFPLASLRTTDDLIGFYQRMGFRPAGRVHTLVRQAQ